MVYQVRVLQSSEEQQAFLSSPGSASPAVFSPDFQYVKPALLELQHLQLLRRRRLLFTRICYGKYSVLLLTWLISLSNTSPPLSRFLVFVKAPTRVGRRGKVPRESILTTTWSNLKLEVETGNLWRFATFRLRASLSLFSLSLGVLSEGVRRRV